MASGHGKCIWDVAVGGTVKQGDSYGVQRAQLGRGKSALGNWRERESLIASAVRMTCYKCRDRIKCCSVLVD